MGYHIVMKRGVFATPYASITVSAFCMPRSKTFGKHTPLHGEVTVVIPRCHLIGTPGERQVVEHYILSVSAPRCIRAVIGRDELASPHTQKPQYHIVGLDLDRLVTYGDAASGCSLTEHGDIATFDGQIGFEMDVTRHIKDNDTFARLVKSLAQ